MKYLLGSKKDFYEFVNSITKQDKLGIITHNDLDGLTSAVFLEKILESKNIEVELIDFIGYGKGMFDEFLEKWGDKRIIKIFLTDMSADGADLQGFENLRKKFDCFLIDHHPIAKGNWNKTNVIKTESADCSGYVLYEFAKDYFDVKNWDWLVTSTMVAEWSFNSEDNLKFLIDKCSDINSREDIESSDSMYLSNIIGASITFHKPNFLKVYNLVKEKNLEELKKSYEIIEAKMKDAIVKYKKSVEYFSDKNIYFGLLENTELVSSSNVITRISKEDYDAVYVIAYVSMSNSNIVKISSRCQSGKTNLNELMKKGIKGLGNASAGGHVKASAAIIQKKDLNKFKENILS